MLHGPGVGPVPVDAVPGELGSAERLASEADPRLFPPEPQHHRRGLCWANPLLSPGDRSEPEISPAHHVDGAILFSRKLYPKTAIKPYP